MSKQELRTAARARVQALRPQRLERSRAACALLTSQPEYLQAANVMAFVGMEDEIDTFDLRDRVLRDGKCLLLPRIIWASRELQPVRISCESEIDCAQRVPQPGQGPNAGIDLAQIDLVVVPGVVFDRRGNRIGRSQGFYDRFLVRGGLRAATCGLALEVQVVEEVPTSPWDVPVQMLVTDQTVRRFKPTGQSDSAGQ